MTERVGESGEREGERERQRERVVHNLPLCPSSLMNVVTMTLTSSLRLQIRGKEWCRELVLYWYPAILLSFFHSLSLSLSLLLSHPPFLILSYNLSLSLSHQTSLLFSFWSSQDLSLYLSLFVSLSHSFPLFLSLSLSLSLSLCIHHLIISLIEWLNESGRAGLVMPLYIQAGE